MKNLLCAFFLLMTVLSISAADHYVRSGATGASSGSDWNNAYTDLPATLTRGDTYYIADGNYGSYSFNDAVSGVAYIYIIKATESSHGSNTGWDSSYGDGTAVFEGPIIIGTSYLDIDGQVGGGPNSWAEGFGIRMQYTGSSTEGVRLLGLEGPGTYNSGVGLPKHINLSHIEFEHRGRSTGKLDDVIYNTIYDVDFTDVSQPGEKKGPGYINIRYCYVHDAGRLLINTVYAHDWLVEYSYFARNTSTTAVHSEAWQDYGSDDITIRYNIFQDIEGSAFIALKKPFPTANDNWYVYGNVFMDTHKLENGTPYNFLVGEGIMTLSGKTTDVPSNNIRFYNNTIINVGGYSSAIQQFSGTVYVYNNTWYNCWETPEVMTRGNIAFKGSLLSDGVTPNPDFHMDYNIYLNTDIKGNVTVLSIHDYLYKLTADPFANISEYDFRMLNYAVSGISLRSEYATDMFGSARANWVRGAIEGNGLSNILKPSGIRLLK